ncbi:MAG: tetratricopeptide repeat protein [Spirochaetaceae bacterium]|jgi:Ca-activated chloride channel family protein|nr:tetratricopeptide repeat protein [Spirochaetaceae bacterium]
MGKIFLRIIFGAALVPLCSCSRISGKLLIMEGNFFFSRGMYSEAVASYLKARDFPGLAPYTEYALGSVYLSLGEGDSALDRFAAAENALRSLPPEKHRELSYRISYNEGVTYFERGDYLEAAEKFRRALEIDSGRVKAKRNLELSLLSLSRRESPVSAGTEAAGEGAGTEALFDYIREKEQNQWKSREWIEDLSAPGPDY